MMLSASTSISPAELEARLRLHRLPEIGPKRFAKLLEALGVKSHQCARQCLAFAGFAGGVQ